MEEKFGQIYFTILGAVALAFGAAELIASAGGGFTWGILDSSGATDPLFLPWRAIILLSVGFFYLSSVKDFAEVHQLAKAVMASIMIWIVAGMAIWTRIASSIPGEETWFNSLEGFLASYAPPYCPEMFLLPFSLVIVYYIMKEKEAEK
ncbi:MAG: hypothetical protein C4B56_01870 [Candidatus Methanophagaceae archaeon]|nr:MAG: hypothetical protein C4B56_01870 [Methanophagales archaeon]